MNQERRCLRGVIHCHSRYSHDSATSISQYLHAARENLLDFIILTDHDTTAGSRALKSAAKLHMPALAVPIAAEYLTDEGDVIVAFLDSDIEARTFPDLLREARRQGAVVMLPHPYVGHRAPEKLAPECDLVETVNCRTRSAQNSRAAQLANSLHKRTYAGSDAHFARSIASAVVEVEDLGSLKSSLLHGRISHGAPRFTTRWEYGASQLIKSWKQRDAKLAMRMMRDGCGRLLGLQPTRTTAS